MLGSEPRDGGSGVDELAAARVQPGLFVPEESLKGGPGMLNQHQTVGCLPDEPSIDEGLEGLGCQAETPSELICERRERGWSGSKDAPIELLGVGGDLKDGQVRAHVEQTRS